MNGYKQYQNQAVNTMTNSEMLMLLLDELVKRTTRAELALRQKDYSLFEQSVERATDIVRYLKSTLNREYPISAELRRMYDFFIYELSRIKAGRNIIVIQEVKPLMKDLCDAFREASKMTNM